MFTDITSRINNGISNGISTPLKQPILNINKSESNLLTPSSPLSKSLSKTLSSSKLISSSAFGEHIKVYLRIRPFTKLEIDENINKSVIDITNIEETDVILSPPIGSHAKKLDKEKIEFKFSHVYNMNSKQLDIYNGCAANLVDSLFNIQSSMLFVYGVSNSGKTYTICGEDNNPGIVPLTIKEIFNKIKEEEVNNPGIYI